MADRLEQAKQTALAGQLINRGLAEHLASEDTDVYDVLHAANAIRRHYKSDAVEFCSIVNAKSGNCSEDCTFCSQSARYDTDAPTYGMLPREQIVAAAEEAARNGARCFGVVIAVKGPRPREMDYLESVYREMSDNVDVRMGGSLGILTRDDADRLFAAGMRMINHNLETSERFFPNICTTHTYKERIDTLANAKAAGMELCSGVIFGMGETADDRLDVLYDLNQLGADSVPMNFLNPIPGTPLGDQTPMKPMEILRWIAIARFILWDRDIRICGGREKNLRDLQSWMFYAGANAAMLGNYLTTIGRPPEDDVRMVHDLGLTLKTHCDSHTRQHAETV